MLEEIVLDKFENIQASNQSMFRFDIDYDEIVRLYNDAENEWREFCKSSSGDKLSQISFMASKGVVDYRNTDFTPAKNIALIRKEVKERLDKTNTFQLLPLDALEFDESLLELAESLENSSEIRDLYKIRKSTTGSAKNSGITLEEASRLKNCFTQGRELFLAGQRGSLMVKPLNFFYSLTAYVYGVIILNNPTRYRKDMIPGSHGLSYLPDSIQAQFGGDSTRGTFSDVVTAFPTHLVKTTSIEFSIDCTDSIIEFYNKRFKVSMGTLLSMIPEMSDYYKLTTGRPSRCYPLDIVATNDPRNLTWEFHIGDGERRPSPAGIDDAFHQFSKSERHGRTVVTVPASLASTIKACIYTDIKGKLWYVDNPLFPIILPEIATHFLISSIFSNIMRYRPDEWGNVILNEVSSSISLVTRHYFASFQRKLLIIILRNISRYVPYSTFA